MKDATLYAPFIDLACDRLHDLGVRRIDSHPRYHARSMRVWTQDQGDPSKQLIGRVLYDHARIVLAISSAREALIVLCHEGGHWLTFLEHGEALAARRGRFASYRYREWLAVLFGWRLVKVIGADAVISWEQWMAHQYDE